MGYIYGIWMANISGIFLYCLVLWNMAFMTSHILEMSSSQLTNSYFSEGWVNHQPVM
jgi:hypothetical protein